MRTPITPYYQLQMVSASQMLPGYDPARGLIRYVRLEFALNFVRRPNPFESRRRATKARQA